jgi:adenylate cyclase
MEYQLPGQLSEKSIVVLPFVNMSKDPDNEYFSDGITEEIINALTKVEGLKVIARTSAFAFKGKQVDIRTIARQLEVNTILEGSVRKASSRIRITAQLINARDGTHFWSQNFDRELKDIFALQDDVSLLIADQIRENFGHLNLQDHLVDETTKSMKAYELFLKGRYFQLKWDPASMRKAIDYYESSLKYDPSFARSYYGNIQCYGLLAAWGYMPPDEGFERAVGNFLKVRELDTKSPEYAMVYVGRTFWMEWDFQATYHQLVQTLERHPHHDDTLEAMTELLLAHGYFEEAKGYIQTALASDPLSPNHHFTLAHIYYYQKEFKKALQYVDQSLTYRTDFPLAKALKAECLIWLNQRESFQQFLSKMKNPELLTILFETINGTRALPPELPDQWKNAAHDRKQLVPFELYILANSGHEEEAFSLLEEYIRQKRGQVINFRQEPFLEVLRSSERFHQLHVSNFHLSKTPTLTPVSEPEPTNIANEWNEEKESLLNYIQKEKPYLDPQLTLNQLAHSIHLHPNQLSLLLNESIGMNFNEFINSYRLETFKKKALDPSNEHLTLLGLAFESGFNSKTVFNTFFKKTEELTPRAWLKNARKS